jgi:hypothetical protein
MKQLIVILTALLAFSFAALAAEDATGNWKATIDTPNGSQVQTFALKMDGGKVTGTIGSEMLGSMQIAEGRMDGDKISFSITSDYGVIRYAGTVSGDTMKLTITVGDGQFTFDITAARVRT